MHKNKVAIIGCSHSDPGFVESKPETPHILTPRKINWVMQMSRQYPTIQFDNYALGGHGHDYQDMALKHCITQGDYGMIVVQLTGDHRGTIPVKSLDSLPKFQAYRHKHSSFVDNYTHYTIDSPRIAYGVNYRKNMYTSPDTALKIKAFWDMNIIGNNWNTWISQMFVDSLTQWHKLMPTLYWFQWVNWPSQTVTHQSNIMDISINEWCKNQWGEDYVGNSTYTMDDDHLNDWANSELLNKLLLKTSIQHTLNQLK